MASWSEFAADEPRLADGIRVLLQQYGPGFGYLATVRADGGPRVHPVSPVITAEGLFCFIIDSPKRRDLERDGRYALHSFPRGGERRRGVRGGARPSGDRSGPRGAVGARAPGPSRRSTGGSSSSPSTWPCSPAASSTSRAFRASRRVGRPFGSGSTQTPRRRGPCPSPSRRRARPASAVTSSARPPDHNRKVHRCRLRRNGSRHRRTYRPRRRGDQLDFSEIAVSQRSGCPDFQKAEWINLGAVERYAETCGRRGDLGARPRRLGYSGAACGCSSMAEHQLPKLTVRVRFPSPAPPQRPWSGQMSPNQGFRVSSV